MLLASVDSLNYIYLVVTSCRACSVSILNFSCVHASLCYPQLSPLMLMAMFSYESLRKFLGLLSMKSKQLFHSSYKDIGHATWPLASCSHM